MKKLRLGLLLASSLLMLASCGGGNKKSGCGGQTCPVGLKENREESRPSVNPMAEWVSPE